MDKNEVNIKDLNSLTDSLVEVNEETTTYFQLGTSQENLNKLTRRGACVRRKKRTQLTPCKLQSGRMLCQLLLTIRYTWVDPLVRLIFSITYSKEKVCLPNGNVVDLCLRYLPLYYSTSRKKVEHLGNFLHKSTM